MMSASHVAPLHQADLPTPLRCRQAECRPCEGAFLSTQHAHHSQAVLRTAGPCTAGEAPASLQATIPLAVYASAFTDCQWMTKARDIEKNRLWCNSTCESVRRIVCARLVSATCCSGRKVGLTQLRFDHATAQASQSGKIRVRLRASSFQLGRDPKDHAKPPPGLEMSRLA